MRDPINPAIEAQAIDWMIRQRDDAFTDWDGFADWLAVSPEHASAFDAVASLDADLDRLPKPHASPIPLVRHGRPVPNRRAWFGGAMAAALVGVIGLSMFNLGDDPTRIETAAGEHRTLTLADGSRIAINGGSVVTFDEDRPRFASLESGEAMFHVVHRDGDPFVVAVGAAKLVDLGTAFNVVHRDRAMSVAVAEGIVAYNPSRQNIRVDKGKALVVREDGGAPEMRTIDAASVGGWRNGQLVYAGAPLSDVADDLNRTAGIAISIDPEVADLPFRGALIVGKNHGRTVDDLAALSGVRARKTADGWLLTR